ncbi:MAG: hypothetical protein PHI22_01180, partial [Bacilli bacterium]|nr:hypothetical protein [Bacilli bacterium]
MNKHKEIWVIAEVHQNMVQPVTHQLITKANSIKGDKKVVVVLFEDKHQLLEEHIKKYGPDEIITIKDQRLTEAPDSLIADLIAQLNEQRKPNSILFGATVIGRSISARLQAKLLTGLTADCLDLSFEDDLLIQIETDPGVNIMFKANNVGANEETLTADAEGMINFVEDYPEAVSLVFFVNPGGETGVNGNLIFTKSILRYVEPEFVPNEPIELNNGFVGDDSGVYTITTDETGVKIDVSKVANQSYAHFYRNVTEAESAGRNTLKVTFKGTAGTSVIVKPNDSAALELTITFDSNGDGFYEELIP